jgi:hypothetical protein
VINRLFLADLPFASSLVSWVCVNSFMFVSCFEDRRRPLRENQRPRRDSRRRKIKMHT